MDLPSDTDWETVKGDQPNYYQDVEINYHDQTNVSNWSLHHASSLPLEM